MTFVRPSTVTNLTTPYTFKSLLPSPSQNYIDQSLPNAIDGYGGGTYAGNLTLTGANVIHATTFTGTTATFTTINGTTVNIGTGIVSGNLSVAGNSDFTLGITSLGITSLDNGAPTYQTPLTRTIVQPQFALVSVPYTSSYLVNFAGYFQDYGGSGPVYYYPMTKLINGAKLTTVNINIGNTTGSDDTSNSAVVSLFKVAPSTGVVTQIGTTTIGATVPTGSGVTYSTTISSLTEVIDDSTHSYFVKIFPSSATGAQRLNWYPVSLVFVNSVSAVSSLNSTVSI